MKEDKGIQDFIPCTGETDQKIQVEYQNNLNQHYLVIRNVEEETYELRMITENQINRLLPVEIRFIDGRMDLYYKISSLQPISKVYKNREMGAREVRAVLAGLTEAFLSIQDYMLEENHVILLPEFIYMKTDVPKIYLLYYPFYDGDIRKGFSGFADYLIGKIDHTDQEAVMIGYQFYRTVREDHFVVFDIITLYSKKWKENQEQKEEELEQEAEEPEMDRESDLEKENPYPSEPVPMQEKSVVKKLAIYSLLSLFSGIFLCFGIGPYRPDHVGKIILVFILLVSILGIGCEIWKKTVKIQKKQPDESAQIQNLQSSSVTEEKSTVETKNDYNDIFADMEAEETYGKTVILSDHGKDAENILIEKKKGKEIIHQMEKFPYIIGKVKEDVDLVLSDISVSRIHARITEENGQIYVEDCKSTNGTYVNGVLLDKEEKIPIDIDDEIRIGRVTLVYQ